MDASLKDDATRLHNSNAEQPAGSERWLLPLYWLAGARWETLREHPETERERIAVLGSSVLIPTTLAFFGMYFYASNRFQTPRVLTCLLVSLVWAFIIMNTDRILLATYRPFQPWGRKLLQVIFRVGLGSVVSVAISLPFCLNQYRPAIKHRYQTESQRLVSTLRAEERTKYREIAEQYRTERERRLGELGDLQKRPIDPEFFADSKVAEEKKRISEPDFVPPASAQTRTLQAQMDFHKEVQVKTEQELESEQDLHRRLVEAMAREKLGQPNEFYPIPKKEGRGVRFTDLTNRDKKVTDNISRLEGTAAVHGEALAVLDKDLAIQRLADRNAYLGNIMGRRDAYLHEAEEKERLRNEQIQRVKGDIDLLEKEHAANLKLHEERYFPRIEFYERKMQGILDPMEETISLYNIIFVPPPDAPETKRGDQSYNWIAGLFQFFVIFGTLFILDLIAILAKVFSRPGSYDVIVEFREFVASQNLRAFEREYPRFAMEWAQGTLNGYQSGNADQNYGTDLNDSAGLAAMLLRSHAVSPSEP